MQNLQRGRFSLPATTRQKFLCVDNARKNNGAGPFVDAKFDGLGLAGRN